jgi:nitroreductase
MTEIGLFDAIHTARALRRFKPDPVPDELITRILEAAICAPSGGNAQEWIFAVIADPEQRRRVGAVYARASKLVRPFYENRPTPAHMNADEERHLRQSGFYLDDHMAEAPVLMLVCGRERQPHGTLLGVDADSIARNALCTAMASVYPAVQNIILACRALGLGTVVTTNHILLEDEMQAALGLPDDVRTYALMPIGYPRDKFGPMRRKPLSAVAIRDRWGNPWHG